MRARYSFVGYTEKKSVTKLQEEGTVRKMYALDHVCWLLQVSFLVFFVHNSFHCMYGVCKSPLKSGFIKNIVKVDMVVWEIGTRI